MVASMAMVTTEAACSLAPSSPQCHYAYAWYHYAVCREAKKTSGAEGAANRPS